VTEFTGELKGRLLGVIYTSSVVRQNGSLVIMQVVPVTILGHHKAPSIKAMAVNVKLVHMFTFPLGEVNMGQRFQGALHGRYKAFVKNVYT
jgi:hypothetical protein